MSAEFFDAAGSFLSGVATLGIFGAGAYGFRKWREEHQSKRKYEIAEKALVAFTDVSNGLKRTWQPLVTDAEFDYLLNKHKLPKPTDDHAQTALFIMMRLAETDSSYDKLYDAGLYASVHLDEEINQIIFEVWKIRNEIGVYCKSLLQTAPQAGEADVLADLRLEWYQLIAATTSPLRTRLSDAETRLKAACKPYLELN